MRRSFAEDCLREKVILITGGAGAIGRVVVRELQDHGARVVVNDVIDEQTAAQSLRLSNDAVYMSADTTSESAVVSLFDRAMTCFGRLDAVLCHAGMVESHPADQYPLESWQRLMDLNVKGSFLVSREAARRFGDRAGQDYAKIVFTSSWVQDVPWPEISAYNTSKAAVRQMMRSLARELAPKRILVNAIAPGIVGVGMAKRQWDTEPSYRARAQRAIPLGQMQSPESVADAFLFLLSDAANYMTGATLLVDGGCSLYPMDE
ncbi:MAG TPA: SDR family oxidoreductase [Tepidisphaeraceae bacterium]|nr:SDR family oxidoreductase [Tepidisphaeraceae bacterium]